MSNRVGELEEMENLPMLNYFILILIFRVEESLQTYCKNSSTCRKDF